MCPYVETCKRKSTYIRPYTPYGGHASSRMFTALTMFEIQFVFRPKRMGSYVILSHCLGSGSFATVHLAVDTMAHRQVACKSIKTTTQEDMARNMKEFKILLALHHVRFHAFLQCRLIAIPPEPNINAVYEIQASGNFLSVLSSPKICVLIHAQLHIPPAMHRWGSLHVHQHPKRPPSHRRGSKIHHVSNFERPEVSPRQDDLPPRCVGVVDSVLISSPFYRP